MKIVYEYILYFFIYSFIGWLMEVICKLVEKRKFVNRGFLVGPICPIYGYGVLLIVLLIGSYKGDLLAVFLKSILVCSILEYLTSYIMEKLFNARWWDYSNYKFNLNGRISLETMLPFGLLGVFVIYFLHPIVESMVCKLNSHFIIILSIILAVLYLFDNIFSFFILRKIKNEIDNANKDNTEVIKQHIDKWLTENTILYRRIRNAYPNFIIKAKKINNDISELKNKYKKQKRKK